MAKADFPITPAVRQLRDLDIPFTPHAYTYEDHGGTGHAARSLGAPEQAVIKTLVMETEGRKPLLVLMHGTMEVSTKQLARILGVKHVTPCDAQTATRHTGYMVGGISPFGTRHPLPVYAQRTIFDLPTLFINGGKRGFLVEITPSSLHRALSITEVDVAIAP